MDTPISIDPDSGRPWRARFDAKTLAQEERMLQAAAYIVCAYLTGMRDCEVQAMRRGCLSIARSERSEEHTSELQSLMRISYAVFCLKKKNRHNKPQNYRH